MTTNRRLATIENRAMYGDPEMEVCEHRCEMRTLLKVSDLLVGDKRWAATATGMWMALG
jgi:hypothetical protein